MLLQLYWVIWSHSNLICQTPAISVQHLQQSTTHHRVSIPFTSCLLPLKQFQWRNSEIKCVFSSWDNHRLWVIFLFSESEKLKQTQRLQQCWCESEKKPWISHDRFCNCNTYKWQAVNQHITRFPYQFQKTVIHLSLSSLPCSPLALQLHYSTSKWGLRFHMAQYQKSTCSHSALNITAEEEQSEHIWRTGRQAWDMCISKRMLCVTVVKWVRKGEKTRGGTVRNKR